MVLRQDRRFVSRLVLKAVVCMLVVELLLITFTSLPTEFLIRSSVVAAEQVVGSLAQMNCSRIHKGSHADKVANIAYWKVIPKDRAYVSGYKKLGPEPKYMSYQSRNNKGLHNTRLIMETYIAFAAATGRTLVLPPTGHLEHIESAFDPFDFFTLQELNDEWAAVDIISTEEFFKREILTGGFTLKPNTSLDKMEITDVLDYYAQLHQLYGPPTQTLHPQIVYVFPYEVAGQMDMSSPRYVENTRLNKEVAERIVIGYGRSMQQAKFLYFPRNTKLTADLPLFYSYFVHADASEGRFYKRLIRDGVRLPDPIFCKASQIITQLHEESKKFGIDDGSFHSVHVRRGDFCLFKLQHGSCRPAGEIYNATKEWVPDGSVLYVATNERNSSFFDELRAHYKLLFLVNFRHSADLDELPSHHISLLEPIILAHGVTFTGTWSSTLSAYTIRLRGYMGMATNTSLYSYPPKMRYAETHYLPTEYFRYSTHYDTEHSVCWEGIDQK